MQMMMLLQIDDVQRGCSSEMMMAHEMLNWLGHVGLSSWWQGKFEWGISY
jgi:hypothetical protein